MRAFQPAQPLAVNIADAKTRDSILNLDLGLRELIAKTIKPQTTTLTVVVKAIPGSNSMAEVRQVLSVSKHADQTIATSTLTNVTDMVLDVTTGNYYYFKFVVLFQSASATVGLKTAVTTPAFTRFGGIVQTVFAADGAAAQWTGAITSSGDAVTTTEVPAATTDYIALIEGTIVPSADGSIQLQAANETGSGNLKVRQGSIAIIIEST